MKLKLLILLSLFVNFLLAQTFTESTQTPPFQGGNQGSVVFSDIDNDGDQDVLLTGNSRSSGRFASLYTNDGSGNFAEMPNSPFEGVNSGTAAFSDINNDGALDLFIAGLNDAHDPISNLYINDGTGVFTQLQNTPFDSFSVSAAAFADIDGDGDEDLAYIGDKNIHNNARPGTNLFLNDGTGNFTAVAETPFEPAWSGSISFYDVDNDGDQDAFITGKNSSFNETSLLYLNDGLGNFTKMENTPFEGVWQGKSAFSDIDNDGDPDLLITGKNSSNESVSNLYTNEGNGNFTLRADSLFEGVWQSRVAFSDIDNDGDQDVLINGARIGKDMIGYLYTNDGLGNFSLVSGTPFPGVWDGALTFSDVDGDGDEDVFISGRDNSGELISKLYINENPISSSGNLNSISDLGMRVFPNPVVSSILNVEYDLMESGFVGINIYDLTGKVLRHQKEYSSKGTQNLSIDVKFLGQGSYFLEMSTETERKTVKFIVLK